jgi:phage shock protein C
MITDRHYRPLYRSREGMIFGVLKGFAEKFDISLFWLRVLVIVTFFLSGFFPVAVVYIIAALVMKPAPALAFSSDEDIDFYMTYTHSRKMALNKLNRQFQGLEQRIRRMEGLVTDKEFSWEQRLRSGN